MSTVAGEHYISASVNGAQKTVTVKFNADASTGQANLQVDTAVQKKSGKRQRCLYADGDR